jgi:hypothetical protein
MPADTREQHKKLLMDTRRDRKLKQINPQYRIGERNFFTRTLNMKINIKFE